MIRLLLLMVALCVSSCGRNSGGGRASNAPDATQPPAVNPPPSDPTPPPTPPPPPAEPTTDLPYVPTGSDPGISVTWYVGISENVPLSQMQSLYQKLVMVNDTLYQVTEGQVRVGRIRIRDGAAPGTGPMTLMNGTIDTRTLDFLVWPDAMWQAPGAGFMAPGEGRAGRLVGIPMGVALFVATHEASHLLWNLSWAQSTGGGFLIDEYRDGVQDSGCIMESERSLRWCSSSNHVAQNIQPVSCWQQIRADYPTFRYSGSNAHPGAPPAPAVEYTDN